MKYDISIDEINRRTNNTEVVNLGTIVNRLNELDFDAPFQRKDLWAVTKKRNLIKSVFDRIPIGSLHFGSNTIIDGKQRLLAIKAFLNGRFPIRILDGKNCQPVFWIDICDPKSRWHFLHTRFLSFQVRITTWEVVDMSEKSKIWQRLNS